MFRWPIVALGLLVLLSGTTSLGGQISFFGVSGLGVVSLAALPVVWGIGTSWYRFEVGLLRVRPLCWLLAINVWAAVSIAWYRTNVPGLQSLVVLLLWLGVTLATTRVVVRHPASARSLMRWLTLAGWLAVILYVISSLAGGPPGENVFGGPRPFGMFTTLPIAWLLARSRYVDRRGFGFVVIAVILIMVSLGRTSLAVSLLLIVFTRFSLRWRSLGRLVAVVVVVAGAGLAISRYEPLQQRQLTGDVQDIGGVRVNVRGRDLMWSLTYESALESPWIGKGLGSAEGILKGSQSRLSHPHNEYLRFWHDHGVIGLGLVLLLMQGVAAIGIRGLRSSQDPGHKAHHLASLGGLLSLAAHSVTANPLEYSFIVIPLGLLFGISIGLVVGGEQGHVRTARQG